MYCIVCITDWNRIGGVMVSVLASSAIDRGFEPRLMKLAFVASLLYTQFYGERTNIGWLGISITCPSEEACLTTDSYFNELVL